jgi:peptidoglycan hydrolase-like protein with peptidoglycan-binding domain
MKPIRYGVAACLLITLGACSDMGSTRTSSQAAVTPPPPPVAPEMVRQVQAKLRDGGYYKQGPVDGVWGAGTQSSVREFQHDHKLAANGQLDVPTLQALNITSGSVADTNRDTVPATQPNYNAPSTSNNPGPAPQR